jgi:hypothetical protein
VEIAKSNNNSAASKSLSATYNSGNIGSLSDTTVAQQSGGARKINHGQTGMQNASGCPSPLDVFFSSSRDTPMIKNETLAPSIAAATNYVVMPHFSIKVFPN